MRIITRIKSFVLLSLILVLFISGYPAEASELTWLRNYQPGGIHNIEQTKDGGYIVGGTYPVNDGDPSDFLIFKLNASGEIQWKKTLTSACITSPFPVCYIDQIYQVKQVSDGGFLAVGKTFGRVNLVVIKLNAFGEVEWNKLYNDFYCYSQALSIFEESVDGGYVFIGGNGNIYGDVSVLKLDVNGNVSWTKDYLSLGFYPNVSSITRTLDNKYLITCGDETGSWYFKINAVGEVEWCKKIPITDVNIPVVTSDGGALLSFNTSKEIIKLDSNGNIQWKKSYFRDSSNPIFFITSLKKSDDGFIAKAVERIRPGIVGAFAYYWYKLDNSGNILWTRKSSVNLGNGLLQTRDGGYLINHSSRIIKLDRQMNVPDCTAVTLSSFELFKMDDSPISPENITLQPVQVSTSILSENSLSETLYSNNVSSTAVCMAAFPEISVDQNSLDFGMINIGSIASKQLLISNTGSADLTVGGVAISGLNAAEFTHTNNCQTVAPNNTCNITVVFDPAAVGARSAELSITSNDPQKAVVNVPLRGTGVDAIPPTVNISTTPTILWPPNHKMVPVTINGSAVDNESGIASVVITVADEYGEYNQTVTGGFGTTIDLEAWRNGTDKDGRVYTITATATDKAGNTSTAVTYVTVPHDMGN